MKTLFDTSALVSALVEQHPSHGRARPWLDQAQSGRFKWAICAHSLAELYSAMTNLPLRPKLPGPLVVSLIRQNLPATAQVIELTREDYLAVLQPASDLGLTGGAVYDALIARAVQKAGVKRVLTFNVDHFRRLWPEGGVRIVSP